MHARPIETSEQDIEHVRLLSIFHYVVAGLVALISMAPIFHVVLGAAIVAGAFDRPGNPDPVPTWFGWMFLAFPAMMMLAGLSMAICMVIAGRKLAARRGHTFCLVMAGIECVFVPFGTALGVFTIATLIKPGVKELFLTPDAEVLS